MFESAKEFKNFEKLLHALAHSWVRSLPSQSYLSVDDLFMEASTAFIENINKYDPDKNGKLNTFIYTVIHRRLNSIISRELKFYKETYYKPVQNIHTINGTAEGNIFEYITDRSIISSIELEGLSNLTKNFLTKLLFDEPEKVVQLNFINRKLTKSEWLQLLTEVTGVPASDLKIIRQELKNITGFKRKTKSWKQRWNARVKENPNLLNVSVT